MIAEEAVRLNRGQFLGSVLRRLTAADVTLAETCYSPGAVLLPHRHLSPTLFLMLRGAFVHAGPGPGVQLAGVATYHPADQVHGAGEVRGTLARGLNVELGPSWHEACESGEHRVRDTISWLVTLLYRELREADDSSTLAIHGLTCQLLAELSRQRRRARSNADMADVVARVVEMLRDNLSVTPDWSAVASHLGCEADMLDRAFQRRMGCRPAEYLRGARIERAKQELAGSTRSIAAIAARAGFYDQPHFTRAFKAMSGMTPGAYRRLMRG